MAKGKSIRPPFPLWKLLYFQQAQHNGLGCSLTEVYFRVNLGVLYAYDISNQEAGASFNHHLCSNCHLI